mmetsp:Transcript_46913/g.101974  ORF Transcript_46913/g.101974 Transcript_46913/m.101974 type:complete len:178 (-) Transcript_46913:201-734(-)
MVEMMDDVYGALLCVSSAWAGYICCRVGLDHYQRSAKERSGSWQYQLEVMRSWLHYAVRLCRFHTETCEVEELSIDEHDQAYSVDDSCDPWLQLLEQYEVFGAEPGTWAAKQNVGAECEASEVLADQLDAAIEQQRQEFGASSVLDDVLHSSFLHDAELSTINTLEHLRLLQLRACA